MVALAMAVAPAISKAQVWSSDPAHSTVMYTIRHMVTPVIGVFKQFDVQVSFDPAKPEEGTISATLDASSVEMGTDKLTDHLKTADFFDVATYPEWTFKSTSIAVDKKAKAENKFIANGKLTVHGVTKDVAIPFEFLGVKAMDWGSKAGFSTEFTLNRNDYGVGKPGGEFVGEDVKVTIYLEMNGKK